MVYKILDFDMQSTDRLAPFDVVLALRLVDEAGTLATIAEELAVVPSQVHTALRRLERCSLLRPGARGTNGRALLEFAAHGIRYAFPARRGPLTTGVPTAYSAPPLSAEFDAIDVVVWPAPLHPAAVQGFGLAPLYRGAHTLLDRAPRTYERLATVDALRLDDPRVRAAAVSALERQLGVRA